MADIPKQNVKRRGGTRVRNTSSEESTGRVDYPTGKFDKWINQDESSTSSSSAATSIVAITDNVTLETEYSVKVTDPGPDEEKVRTLMFGSDSRRNNSFSTTSRLFRTERDMLLLVNQLASAGAKFRVGKMYKVASACPLKDGKVDEAETSVGYSVEVTALGRFANKSLDLLLGADRNPNLQISLPFKLNYSGAKKAEAFALVEQLASFGASVTVTQYSSIDIPLN